MTVIAEDVRDVARSTSGNTHVFEEVSLATDLVQVVDTRGVEELRVVHGPLGERPLRLRWRVRLGPALSTVRVAGERFEAVDAWGRARIGTEPVLAVDAHGVKRTLSLRAGPREGAEVTLDATLDVHGLASPLVIDPVWRAIGVMVEARFAPSAVLLKDGRVLVSGGCPQTPYDKASKTSEIFDPSKGTWAIAGSMISEHCGHGLVLLGDGKVLATAGLTGWGSSTETTVAELFDPVKGTWTATSSLAFARGSHTVTLLDDGRVAVIGGPETIEIYDPKTSIFTAGGKLVQFRGAHAAVLLPSKRLLVAGGQYVDKGFLYTLSSAEIYDPSTGTSTATGSLSTPRPAGTAQLLPSGLVLLVGGNDYSKVFANAEVFDEKTGKWTVVSPMLAPHSGHGSTLVDAPTPRVIVIGGFSEGFAEISSAEVFDASSSSWSSLASLPISGKPGSSLSAIRLLDGRALVVGASAVTPQSFVFSARCTASADCPSGFCVDGVCCNKKCSEACEACDEPGSIGTCTTISGPPRALHADCGAYLCASGVCATSCTTKDDCLRGGPCVSGACVPQKKQGTACDSDEQCITGLCVDKFCCDLRCDSPCKACDVPTQEGHCVVVKGPPHPGKRPTCGKDPFCGPQCDDGSWGVKCGASPAAGTKCDSDRCVDGVEHHAGSCKSDETCDGAVTPCTPYACGATLCKKDCDTDADCASSFFCSPQRRCVVAGAGCSADLSASIDPTSGSLRACAPYKCRAGACRTTCTTTDDCASPNVCESGACVAKASDAGTDVGVDADVPGPGPDPDDGKASSFYGCEASGAAKRSSPISLALLLLVVARLAKRRSSHLHRR